MKIQKTCWLWRVAYGWRVTYNTASQDKIPEKTNLCHFVRVFLGGLFMWPCSYLIYTVCGFFLNAAACFVFFWFGRRLDYEGPRPIVPIWMPSIRGFRILPIYFVIVGWVIFSFYRVKQINQGPTLTDITTSQILQVETVVAVAGLCILGLCMKFALPASRLVDRAMKHVPFPRRWSELPCLPKLTRPKTPEWWTVAKTYGKSLKDKTCVLVTFE